MADYTGGALIISLASKSAADNLLFFDVTNMQQSVSTVSPIKFGEKKYAADNLLFFDVTNMQQSVSTVTPIKFGEKKSVTNLLTFSIGTFDMSTILTDSLTQEEIDFARGVLAAIGYTASKKFTIVLPGGLHL